MGIPSADAQVAFLRNIQSLLEDGQFVATYKYALLIALADLSVEADSADDRELPISLLSLAEKFIDYYWQQCRPFPGRVDAIVLLQNTARQAEVITVLRRFADPDVFTLTRAKLETAAWSRLVRRVASIIKRMPLFRLQTIGDQPRTFLYDNELVSGGIVLKPGVAYNLRQFHALIAGLARDRWLSAIRSIGGNQSCLDEGQDLESFLFGSERESVAQFAAGLADVQHGECLYCCRPLREVEVHVDHFIPWSLHRLNAIPNLVAVHPKCNLDKRNYLAAAPHIRRWVERNRSEYRELRALAGSVTGPRTETCQHVAAWAYDRALALQQRVWLNGRQLVELDSADVDVLRH